MKTFRSFQSQPLVKTDRFHVAEFALIEGTRSRVVTLRYPKNNPPIKLRNYLNGNFYFPTGLRDAGGRLIYRMEEQDGQKAEDGKGDDQARPQDRPEDRAQREPGG